MTGTQVRSPAKVSAARAVALGIGLPFVAGAVCVFGFAPFYAWPVPMAAVAALFYAWSLSGSPRQAWLSGFVFGLGYFLTGVSWVYVSLHDFGGMPAVLAALATFLFCAYLALWPALAGWLTLRFAGRGMGRRLTFAAAAFVACEWVRGWLFTGFPWLTLGTSQVPEGPLAAFATYVGAYGTSLGITSVASTLVMLFVLSGRARAVAAGALVAILLLAFAARLPQWTQPAGAAVKIALLQGNIAQEIKWRDEMRTRTLEAYRQMIFAAKARVVVIPETALPAFLDELPPAYVESLRQHARAENKDILLGTVERKFVGKGQDYEYFNSLVTLTGGEMQAYRKRHLVPFGEFIPIGFHWVLAILHIPLSDFSRGPAEQPPLGAAGIRFGVAICYEDIFGEEVIRQLPAAQVLVNVSNDAWFGKSFAAEQHLQASQMRALETGRWMVRSTNTGASAAIDEHGRVVSRLEPFTAATLLVDVVPRNGSTPYVRWGNLAVLWIVFATLAMTSSLGAALRSRRRAL
ncbi:MAG TPA: apolipoprotein N-acyltransferase [Usitatibacter sp.]|nr:apolipoprotein N-acyltransferase [Usitatibacter sp.]